VILVTVSKHERPQESITTGRWDKVVGVYFVSAVTRAGGCDTVAGLGTGLARLVARRVR
jgi:hypothetical protein